jgi:hypothetical protein
VERVNRREALAGAAAIAVGGHFAALEEPKLLADDVRLFFRKLR